MNINKLLELAAIRPEDVAQVYALLEQQPTASVDAALHVLRARIGMFDAPPLPSDSSEFVWISALLRFLPEQLAWYQQRGIPEKIAHDTVAEIGRHIAISRTTTGEFGLETWKWVCEQASGSLYQLGRLQFQLQVRPAELSGIVDDGMILSVHIPEGGGISSAAVQDSFAQARTFFATYFQEHPVKLANCVSWLLDPYLIQQLPADTNITRFASLFTLYGELMDTPSDAVYFTFRSRNHTDTSGLPRDTLLQRIVLERIDNGGAWQLGQGYVRLD